MSEMILVTPEYLRKVEGELAQTLQAVKANYAGAVQSLRQVETCFCAECVKKLTKKLTREQETGEATLERLKIQMQKLSAIADTYEEAERSNADATQTGK